MLRARTDVALLTRAAFEYRYVVRRLWRSPRFALIVVMTLALGIGVNATVFTIMNAALFEGFPLVKHNERVVYVTTTKNSVYYPDFVEWRASATSLEDLALARNVYTTLSAANDDPYAYFTTEVTANMFTLLGVRPFLGRDFVAADDQPGATPVALLRYDLWQGAFGADPGVVGRSVRINGVPATIIGVMPRGFSFPSDQSLWVPLIPTKAALDRETPYARYAVARLADRATIETAGAELATISKRLEEAYPATNRGVAPVLQTFAEWSLGPKGAQLYETALGAVFLVLLIVGANTANLLIERAVGRSHDVAIQLAVGSSHSRAVQQVILESLTLSLLGGAVGWLLSEVTLRAYTHLLPSGDHTRVLSYAMNYKVLGYLVGMSLGTGLAIGLAAAIGLAKIKVADVLRGAHAGISRREVRLINGLIATQIALAVVLLASTGVLIRSFINVATADVGVTADDLLSMSLYVPPEKYADAATRASFYSNLGERLALIPGVESVGFGTAAPAEYLPTSEYQIDDAQIGDNAQHPAVGRFVADVGYFATLGIPVVAGRAFDRSDRADSMPVAIINARFAATHWAAESPIGKRLRLRIGGKDTPWLTIVGVVGNVVQNDRNRQAFDPLVYVPYAQSPEANMFTFARTRVSPSNLVGAFRREVYELDPTLPVPALWPLSERFDRLYAFERLSTKVLLTFACVAVFIASFGLYATLSLFVSKRTHEIGVRAALGATRRDIYRLVCANAGAPVGIGLAVGLAASPVVNSVLASQLVRVSTFDPAALGLAAVVLVLAGVMGGLIPARRAVGVDPALALRHE